MEHINAWGGPFEFQLAVTNRTADDDQAWAAPAAGHPLEYASIVDIFGSSCSVQPYFVPASSSSSSGGQQQLVEYNYYAAAAQHDDPTGKETTMTHENLSLSEEEMEELFEKRKDDFFAEYNAKYMKLKMHRYPPSIRALDDEHLYYTVPRVVSIGPYHHFGGDHLKEAENVKHVAAIRCMDMDPSGGLTIPDLYQAVVSAATKIEEAGGLYDNKDVMEGMNFEEQFLPMMFYDACFLVMYMVKKSGTSGDKVLFDYFESNEDDIAHDIMLLENQIPWPLVKAVMNKLSTLDPVETTKRFIANCKDSCLQDRVSRRWPRVDLWDPEDYNKAPHLLGLLRSYVVGKSSCCRSSDFEVKKTDSDKIKSIPISAGAIELAEMGISLAARETTSEIPADMGLHKRCIFFAKLPIAPLSLKDLRASMLVNMAALELCTTQDFLDKEAKREDSAVCSYLLLLCMLMHREEDVHELRRQGILQGAGLTNTNTLAFFTSLQSLRMGICYVDVMVQIERYRMKKWGCSLWLYKFLYQNGKIILGSVTVLGTLAGIYGAFKPGK